MALRARHLNCGTMCPYGARLIHGHGGLLAPGKLVCHCLLVETSRGLVLVDTGFGERDLRAPAARLGRAFLANTRPLLAPEETAVARLRALGHDPRDVRDLVLTHLDLDHAGGLADFPEARVHVAKNEHAAAMARSTLFEKGRYRPAQWSHDVQWVEHAQFGERFMGFEAVRALDPKEPDVLLVPLTGHTRGHCAVAVRTDRGWLLHAGDAYMHHGEVHGARRTCPPGLDWYGALIATDRSSWVRNQDRLRALTNAHAQSGELTVFCAHSVDEFDALAGA